ncbi:hypothetical protein [Ornithinimicrobium flavum]|uniref:hypothetical protein n=1 Tax=Ornithinimicrobium flavum TaxID=1288636 RepID=UPI001EE7A550|nr:hypothetical protein [Ornithinimicrobium flavum]
MTLRPVRDPGPAQWLTEREQPWPRLALFGPPPFEAYARLLFIPDPTFFGQDESDHDGGDRPGELEQLRAVVEVLGRHTSTPEVAWHCLWDGWGDLHHGATVVMSFDHSFSDDGGGTSRPGVVAFAPDMLGPPTVHHPHRSYHLFTGPLSDLGDWGAREIAPGMPRRPMTPSFVWPEDRAWCIAADVDPHWAGIGASQAAVDELVALSTVDVVPADPSQPQPFYG